MKYYIGSIPFDSESALSHHGIIGQKWGVRRFQDEHGRLTPAGRERYGVGEAKNLSAPPKIKTWQDREREDRATYKNGLSKPAEFTEEVEKYKNSLKHDPEKRDSLKNFAKLSLYQILSLGPVSLATIPVYVGRAAHGNIKMENYLKLREQMCKKDPKTGLYLKNEPVTDDEKEKDEDMKVINPDYHNFSSNSKNNCMCCAVTYDLRRRGYEVTSQKDAVGYPSICFRDWYPTAELKKVSPYNPEGDIKAIYNHGKQLCNNFINDVKNQNGSRGALMINCIDSGHCISYEVRNNNVIFRDCQDGSKYTEKKMINLMSTIPVADLTYARLDNVKPNMKSVVKECVR